MRKKYPATAAPEQSVPCQSNFIQEHLREARNGKTRLDYRCLAYISKGTQPATHAVQSNSNQTMNDSNSSNNYPTYNPNRTNSSNSKRPRYGKYWERTPPFSNAILLNLRSSSNQSSANLSFEFEVFFPFFTPLLCRRCFWNILRILAACCCSNLFCLGCTWDSCCYYCCRSMFDLICFALHALLVACLCLYMQDTDSPILFCRSLLLLSVLEWNLIDRAQIVLALQLLGYLFPMKVNNLLIEDI